VSCSAVQRMQHGAVRTGRRVASARPFELLAENEARLDAAKCDHLPCRDQREEEEWLSYGVADPLLYNMCMYIYIYACVHIYIYICICILLLQNEINYQEGALLAPTREYMRAPAGFWNGSRMVLGGLWHDSGRALEEPRQNIWMGLKRPPTGLWKSSGRTLGWLWDCFGRLPA
jgi:hypothetical protein